MGGVDSAGDDQCFPLRAGQPRQGHPPTRGDAQLGEQARRPPPGGRGHHLRQPADARPERRQPAGEVELDQIIRRANHGLQSASVVRKRLGGDRQELQQRRLDQQPGGGEVRAAQQQVEGDHGTETGPGDDGGRLGSRLDQRCGVLALLLDRRAPVPVGRARSAPPAPVIGDRAGALRQSGRQRLPDRSRSGRLVDQEDRPALAPLAPGDLDAAGLQRWHALDVAPDPADQREGDGPRAVLPRQCGRAVEGAGDDYAAIVLRAVDGVASNVVR